MALPVPSGAGSTRSSMSLPNLLSGGRAHRGERPAYDDHCCKSMPNPLAGGGVETYELFLQADPNGVNGNELAHSSDDDSSSDNEIIYQPETIEVTKDIYAFAYLLARWASARTPRLASTGLRAKFWIALIGTACLQGATLMSVAIFDPMGASLVMDVECSVIQAAGTRDIGIYRYCPQARYLCMQENITGVIKTDCQVPYNEAIFRTDHRGAVGNFLVAMEVLMCAWLLRYIYQSEMRSVMTLFELHIWFSDIAAVTDAGEEHVELLFPGNWPLVYPCIQLVIAVSTATISCCVTAGSCSSQAVVLNAMTFLFVIDVDTYFNDYFLGSFEKEHIRDARCHAEFKSRPILSSHGNGSTYKRWLPGGTHCILPRRYDDFLYRAAPLQCDKDAEDKREAVHKFQKRVKWAGSVIYFAIPCICLLALRLSNDYRRQ